MEEASQTAIIRPWLQEDAVYKSPLVCSNISPMDSGALIVLLSPGLVVLSPCIVVDSLPGITDSSGSARPLFEMAMTPLMMESRLSVSLVPSSQAFSGAHVECPRTYGCSRVSTTLSMLSSSTSPTSTCPSISDVVLLPQSTSCSREASSPGPRHVRNTLPGLLRISRNRLLSFISAVVVYFSRISQMTGVCFTFFKHLVGFIYPSATTQLYEEFC